MQSRSITLDEFVSWINLQAPTLIVAGAGLSIPSPTDAPGVREFLRATTQVLHERCSFHPESIVLPNPLTGEPVSQLYVGRLFPEMARQGRGQVGRRRCRSPKSARSLTATVRS